jgi:hypothetical protein
VKGDHEALLALYSKVPRLDCKRKCQEVCGPIGMGEAERRRMVFFASEPSLRADNVCGYLDDRRLCSVYAARPMVCRLWGTTKRTRCPWGCEPERWLSNKEAGSLLRRADAVGGGTVFEMGAARTLFFDDHRYGLLRGEQSP